MKYRPIRMAPQAACAALHRRRVLLLDRIAALRRSPDTEFAQQFLAVVAQVESAFRHEESLLELLGDACLHPRRADHATILCALHRTAARVEGGDLQRGREVAAALEAILDTPQPAFQAARASRRPVTWMAH